jgi:signal transduction histidine kinase
MKKYSGIIGKVILGFAIIAGLMASTYWITYNNLNALKNKINALSELNPKYVYRKKIVTEINDIDSYINKFTVSKDFPLLEQYDSTVVILGQDMDTLNRISADNKTYHADLRNLGYYIKTKLDVSEDLISLANSSNSQSELSKIIEKISEPQKQLIPPPSQEDSIPEQKKEPERGRFSRWFSHNRNKEKAADTIAAVHDTVKKPDVILKTQVKTLLQKAEENENEKTTQFLKETFILTEKNDNVQDSIDAVSTELEKLEITESLNTIGKLTDETKKKTADILTNLILSGIFIMLVFIVIVYRSVRRNNKLRNELIEEKKNTEHLAKVKEEFLANMSHEIRTPMNIIMGFSEQLLKTKLTDEQKNHLLSIKRSSNHLITILNEILDYSKMESGMVTLESIEFSIVEIVNDVVAAFKNSAEKKGIEFNCKIDPAVHEIIIGDPVRLKQILFNLAGNAIKFTDKGSVSLFCSAASSNENSQTILFEIKDTGIGMSAESLKTIFDQFTQADSSVTRRYGGTGLGLAISKKLVEIQNGEIGVNSEPGKGSVFHFTIPYKIPTKEKIEKSIPEEITNKKMLSGKKVLIADDDEMNKILVKYILESCDMKIDTAANGMEAFDKIMQGNYDVVLMDMQMPQMGGLEVVTKIREKKNSVPVIAVTGNVLQSEKEKCFSAGMNGYVSKPFNEKELLEKIIELIKSN